MSAETTNQEEKPTMKIPVLAGTTDREKLASREASIQKLRTELKKLDWAIIDGDIEAAQRHAVIMTQLHAIDRVTPLLEKQIEAQKRQGAIEAAQIRTQAQLDFQMNRTSVDTYEAEMARAARVERGFVS